MEYDGAHREKLQALVSEHLETPEREEAAAALNHHDFLWAQSMLVKAVGKKFQQKKLTAQEAEGILAQIGLAGKDVMRVRAQCAGLLQ